MIIYLKYLHRRADVFAPNPNFGRPGLDLGRSWPTLGRGWGRLWANLGPTLGQLSELAQPEARGVREH